MELLRCLCWHALPLSGVTPTGFLFRWRAVVRFTSLITQANMSDKLRRLLEDASYRDRKIPYRGQLLDLFGVQIIHCDSPYRWRLARCARSRFR